jgi:hypothetical protein
MPDVRTVNIADRIIDLHSASGVVLSEKKWTTTQISGGGGGGYVQNGSGYVTQNPIQSTTTTHDQLLVKVEDGSEHAVQIAGANLAVREGHRVSLIWGISRGKSTGPYVGIYNHDTRQMNPIEQQFRALIGPKPFAARWLVVYGVLLVLCFTPLAGLSFLGFFLGLPVLALVRYLGRRKQLREEIGAVAQGLKPPVLPAAAAQPQG